MKPSRLIANSIRLVALAAAVALFAAPASAAPPFTSSTDTASSAPSTLPPARST